MKWRTPDERAKLETWLDSGFIPGGKCGPENRLFLAIALDSGLRESEILTLIHNQANVTAGKWEAVVRLKRTDRARIDAAMGSRTRRIYLETYPNEPDPYAKIFPNGPTANTAYKFVRLLGSRLGIPNLHPHQFRHTLARDMAVAGAKPPEIQGALGHQSGTSSLIYYESTNEEAISAAKKVRD